MKSKEFMMKIGELASAAQCTVETIRYYEKQGLLPPALRSGNNYRLYDATHLQRLIFIRNCRALDMSQKEVDSLLGLMDQSTDTCESVNAVVDEHIAHVERRIEELRRLKSQLQDLRDKCHNDTPAKDCRILEGISNMPPQVRSVGSHL